MRNGELGFWWRSLGGVPDPRPPLDGPCEADVAIVGAGFTGLWLAPESGLGEHDLRAVEGEQLKARLRVSGARLATFTPHVARVHPARLLAGLRSAVERLGVSVYEHTCVRELRPREALTPAG